MEYTLTLQQDDEDLGSMPATGEVFLARGGRTQYSQMRELMYIIAPILDQFKCPVTLFISDGSNSEHPGDPPIAKEEPLSFESWRKTVINGVHDAEDPCIAFIDYTHTVSPGTLVRTYAAGLGMFWCEEEQYWCCLTDQVYTGDIPKLESALYAYYIGTFIEYISGTEMVR